ncbi:hypothetical protein CSHISOI_01992 [Colletotrichum shisoi]|uniref:Wac domain-containing protein n=1 Tax=Colletotrichum shisoi TaxID=2078593 RepID=A0A5Q4C2C1_9PEZI|nr:hypothetical protein CSHISOI_01992 [Colletotrichum shisoi]
MASTHDKSSPQPLSRDDYIDLRNAQDKHLNVEFTSIRHSIDLVKIEVDEVKTEVGKLKTEVGKVKTEVGKVKTEVTGLNFRMQRLENQTQRLEAEIRQSKAYIRNNALRNPTLPIRPLVIYHPERGILEPNELRFPRNADEFYALRDPQTDRHRSMLAYLAMFYDVRLRTADYTSDDESSDDEVFIDRPDLVIEKLEDILGLNEDKFIKFRERARNLASRTPPKPIKRSQALLPNDGSIPVSRRPRLELPQRVAGIEGRNTHDTHRQTPENPSSENLTNARLGWGTRSTPSSQQPRIRCPDEHTYLPELAEPEPKRPNSATQKPETEAAESDIQTRAFTSPREP